MKNLERITKKISEEYTVYEFDLSHLRDNAGFWKVREAACAILHTHPPKSVRTLSNIEGMLFDSETKRLAVEWMADNEPYVQRAAIAGVDGIKRIMLTSVLKNAGRDSVKLFETREEALQWLTSSK